MVRALYGYVPFRKYYTGHCIPRKYSENVVDYFPSSKNGETESVSTQKLFHTIVGRSKSPIEKIDIFN